MDRASIERLFTFTEYSWRTYEEHIRPHGDDLLARPAPGSGWPALVDALGHINRAYVRWLASPDGTTPMPEPHERTWEDLNASRRAVRDHARGYLESLDDAALATARAMDIDGEPIAYSPGEILAHVFLHERQHHGDLNTLLYQLGLEVPIVEYRFSLARG